MTSGRNRPRSSSNYTCKAFVRSVVVLSWLCIVCIKCMKPVSFNSTAETDVVKRFPTSAKVFVSASAGARTRDLPHALATELPRLHIYIYIYIYIYVHIPGGRESLGLTVGGAGECAYVVLG